MAPRELANNSGVAKAFDVINGFNGHPTSRQGQIPETGPVD